MSRRTVNLDDDVNHMLRTAMRERGITLSKALNETIRAGAKLTEIPHKTKTKPTGGPR